MPYYYEKANFAGIYRPHTSADKPSVKTLEGRVKLRNIIEISDDDYETKSLSDLYYQHGHKPDLEQPKDDSVIAFKYTNHLGETAIRECVLLCIEYVAVPEYYDEAKHWFLQAFDCQKRANRSFLLTNCDFTTTTEDNETNIFTDEAQE